MSSVRTLSIAPLRGAALVAALMLSLMAAACGGQMFGRVYEYEEDLYVSLDGSAELIVNASIPALVTLRGLDASRSRSPARHRSDSIGARRR